MTRILQLIFLMIALMLSGCDGETSFSDPCSETETFCHMHEGLEWSAKASVKMSWNEAVEYCDSIGGRLPTLSELRSLILYCSVTESGGECKVDGNCLELECWNEECAGCEWNYEGMYSVFEDTEYLWSSSFHSSSEDYAWDVCFGNGYVGNYLKLNKNHVRCVKK